MDKRVGRFSTVFQITEDRPADHEKYRGIKSVQTSKPREQLVMEN
jgi:hypothetical protein